MRRLLVWTIPPAVVVAALGVDQAFGWFGTLDWLHVQAPTARLRITSTIGNPGDLAGHAGAAVADRRRGDRGRVHAAARAARGRADRHDGGAHRHGDARRGGRDRRGARGVDAAAAVARRRGVHGRFNCAASRRRRMAVLLAGALVLVLAVAGLAASTPLRARVSEKVMQLASGDLERACSPAVSMAGARRGRCCGPSLSRASGKARFAPNTRTRGSRSKPRA